MAQSLTHDEASALRGILVKLGAPEAAKLFQLNTTTLLRASAGLAIHNATCQVISQRLEQYART